MKKLLFLLSSLSFVFLSFVSKSEVPKSSDIFETINDKYC